MCCNVITVVQQDTTGSGFWDWQAFLQSTAFSAASLRWHKLSSSCGLQKKNMSVSIPLLLLLVSGWTSVMAKILCSQSTLRWHIPSSHSWDVLAMHRLHSLSSALSDWIGFYIWNIADQSNRRLPTIDVPLGLPSIGFAEKKGCLALH